MRNFLTSALLLCVSFFLAQNENTKWYFGNKAGLDFMTTPPTVLNNSASNSMYGCASAADASGNLLFYTDGNTVFNSNHVTMANGTALGTITNTNQLLYQYTLIVKQPGNANIYFVFSNCNTGTLAGLYCSTVDMSLAAGLGSVTVKNAVVSNVQPSGQLAVVQHCNGVDCWVISHDYGSANFRAFLVSSAGVNNSPVISTLGYNGAISSYMKVSRNGKKIATTYNSSYLTVYDFDAATAIISNSLAISTQTDGAVYNATEFSPDGTKLYCTKCPFPNHHVSQWNLCAGTASAIIASEYSVSASNLTSVGMQLAPDGKIYVARFSQTALGVINNPNTTGAGCNYVNAGQLLSSGTCSYALPAFVAKPLKSPPFTFSLQCQTGNFTNTAATSTAINNCSFATFSLVSCSWNFGDPASGGSNTTTAQNPTHFYSSTGTFTTILVLNYKCFNDTLKQVVTVTAFSPIFAVSGPTAICKGEAAVFTASSGTNLVYNWSSGQSTNSISVTPTANVNYTATATTGGCVSSKVVSLVVNKCTGVGDRGTVIDKISIYPNPVSHLLMIDSELPGSTEITVRDQLGQIVFSGKLSDGKNVISVEGWRRGFYFMTLNGDGFAVAKKLLVD